MNTLHRSVKPVTLAILCALLLPTAQAELENGSWIVQSGDGLYSIARKLAPKDLKMQARIRSEISQLNPTLNPENLEIGMSLKLPSFLFQNQEPTPAATPAKLPEPPGRMQISKPAMATPDPQEVIGKVVIQSGSMVAENRGSSRKLNRTASILKGDTLKTAANARSQVRLKDGALIAISPGTELKFEEFAYNGSEDGTERSIINLIKGGFRTITGAIGHVNKQNYQVKTSVATIGIRGTHYGLMLCESGSCQNNPEAGNLDDGLYGGVVDGSIVTSNESGTSTFNNDQYFHIQTAQAPAVETLLPPPIFNDAPAPGEKANDQEMAGLPSDIANDMLPDDGQPPKDDGSNFTHSPLVIEYLGDDFLPPKDEFNPTQLPPPPNDSLPPTAPEGSGLAISLTQFGANGLDGVAAPVIVGGPNGIFLEQYDYNGKIIKNLPVAISESSTEVILDQFGNPITITTTHEAARLNGTVSATYDESQFGGDPIGVNWGVWNGQYLLLENGNEVSHDIYAHFIYSDNLTTLAQQQSLGGLTATFRLYDYIGGTTPTSSGTMPLYNLNTNITAAVDFSSQTLLNYNIFLTGQDIYLRAWLTDPVKFADLGHSFQLMGENLNPYAYQGEASFNFVGDTANAAITAYTITQYDTSTSLFTGALNGVALLAPGGSSTPNIGTSLIAASDGLNSTTFAVGGMASGSLFTDSNNNPVALAQAFIDTNGNNHHQSMGINPSQSTLLGTGSAFPVFDDVPATTGSVNWGYWDNATVIKDSTTIGSITDRVHFISSDYLTTQAQLGGLIASAVAQGGGYTPMQYGTTTVNATDGLGNPLTGIAGFTMVADFSTHQITNYDINTGTLAATLANPVDFSAMGRGFSLVALAACSVNCASGTASAQFVGPNAENVITSFAIQSTITPTTRATGTALMVDNW